MQQSVTGRNHIRSQSETLGVVLLLGIAVVGAVAVVTTGYAVLDSDQEQVSVEQAERSLSQFDVRSSGVALGRSDGERIDFGLPDTEGSMSVRPDAGWMRVRYTDLTAIRDPNTAIVANTTLGSVVFQQGDQTVGYQAGGVFRSNGNRSALVSRPEFHYRNGTLTVPIIRTDGQSAVASRVQVTPNGTVRKFPDASRNLTNKVENTTVVITVHSRYYEAWAEFFSQYTRGIVSTNATRQLASVQFISLPDDKGVAGGVIATAESGALVLKGTGAYVDAYDSSNGPYNGGTTDGIVKAVGNITITADATIDGTARTGNWLKVENPDAKVSKDGEYTIDYVNDGVIGGDLREISSVPTVLPIDTLVTSRLQKVKASNDNDQANNESGVESISDGLDVSSSESVTLGSGRYYMETLNVEGGDLVLDTTNGNITLAVRDWMKVVKSGGDGGNITVKGDGIVKVYLTSKDEKRVSFTGSGNAPTRNLNFFVGKEATVHIPGDVAPRFRVFAPQETQTAIAGSQGSNATFHGLIYAPDGLSLSGTIYTKQANVYGGLVAGKIILGQYGQVHYDQNLDDIVLPRASRVSRLEYLHVAIHRMNVTSR